MLKFPSIRPEAYSLKIRFAMISVALFLISVWGMAGYVAYELKNDMEKLLAEQQRAMANSIAQSINSSVLLRRESLLSAAADITPEILHDSSALAKVVSEHQAMRQLFDVALIVTTPARQVLAEYPSRPREVETYFAQHELARAIIEERKFAVGLPALNLHDKTAVIPFGAPIMGKNGEVLGILFGITSLLANEFIDHAIDLKSDIGYLVISRGTRMILAANDKSKIMDAVPVSGEYSQLNRFLAGYEGSGVAVNFRGIEELSSGKSVSGTDWVVVITMPTDDAFSPAFQIRKRIFVSAAILSLVVAMLTWLFVHSILKPLEQLINSVRKMGSPDFPLHQLDIKPSGPELEKLIDAFNHMQQRIAEQAAVLRENQARFYFVADQSPMLIWISDETGRRIWFNQTWLKTTSRSLEQVTADTWSDDIHPDDRTQYMDAVAQAIAARKSIRTKFRLREAGGAYRWFLEMAVPRFIDGHRLAGYVGSCLDIDEQVSAQRSAENLLGENRKLMAERFNIEEVERQRMARDLHDDLGQWLTAISANAEAICAIASPEAQAAIHHCATSIASSTVAIQDFVRAMNRKLGSNTLATLGLKESLVELVAVWREYQSDIATELTLDDDPGRLDNHLETTVFRLAQEALTNVARHAKASRVCLGLRRLHTNHGDELLLSIMDDGIGFDPESDSRGVGLISMRERAVMLGGVCKLVTVQGKGTTVEVRIPLGFEALVHAGDQEHVNS